MYFRPRPIVFTTERKQDAEDVTTMHVVYITMQIHVTYTAVHLF